MYYKLRDGRIHIKFIGLYSMKLNIPVWELIFVWAVMLMIFSMACPKSAFANDTTSSSLGGFKDPNIRTQYYLGQFISTQFEFALY